MNEILKDVRFAHIPRDPAFKRIPKKERKVKIDRRFQSMFSDKNFKVKLAVDNRGRPVQNSSTENLRRYYALDSSDESENVSDNEATCVLGSSKKNLTETNLELNKKQQINNVEHINNAVKKNDLLEIDEPTKILGDYTELDYSQKTEKEGKYIGQEDRSEDQEDHTSSDSGSDFNDEGVNDELDTDFRTLNEKVRTRLQDLSVDYARGEGVILSDSSSDEEDSEEEEYDEDVEHRWGELDQDAGQTDESTKRIAVCNMDWDRIKAPDLMVLFHSFLPKGGVIHSISVYPSEYGLQRMKEEDEKGPLELRDEGEATVKSDGGDDDDDEEEEEEDKKKRMQRDDDEVEEGDQYRREKLRQYQLNRLRYYYAVIVCDSVATADALYKECDGMEYESSASRLDLRFIPDDISFDQEPRESCSQLPNMTKYEPQLFITTALQQSNVKLTWDETDPRRLKLNEKINTGKVDELDDQYLKVYLATSSEEESSKEEDEKKERVSKYRALLESINSEEVAKKEKSIGMEVTWGINLKDKVEKRVKESKEEEMTPFQKYMQKRKEKRKAMREEQHRKKQLQKEGNSDGGNEEENADNSGDDIPSDIDMNDTYFREEFDKKEFAHTKDVKKNKKKKKKGVEESEGEETKQKKAELELLLMDEDDNKRHFSLKDILIEDLSKTKKKKKKKNIERGIEDASEKKDDDFQMNVQDQRFSALFTSHLYNIDPVDPHYKKTKGMEILRQEKLNRRATDEEVPTKKPKTEIPETKKKMDAELSLLIKNVEKKVQSLKR